MDHIAVTVNVPADRMAEFHQMFGRWLATDVTVPGAPGAGDRYLRWEEADPDLAVAYYRAVSPKAARILNCWMDATELVDADATAKAGGLEGPYHVAGCLSSLGKASSRLNVELPFEHFPGEGGTPSRYRMLPAAAALFRAARDRVGAR